MDSNDKRTTNGERSDEISAELLRVAAQLMNELHPHRQGGGAVHLGSALDRDLGLDSLGRVELFTRIGRVFKVVLPDRLFSDAETLSDLHAALLAIEVELPALTTAGVRQATPEAVEEAPETAATLLDVLDWHCRAHPERIHIRFYEDGTEGAVITYGDLKRGAERAAGGLVRHGLEAGQTVAIMLATSADYFFTFFGILRAGGIPVPIYPPARLSRIEDHLLRHAGILENARSTMLVTLPEARSVARLLKTQVAGLRSVVTPAELIPDGNSPAYPLVTAHDTALLQYTSGSTGNPKGVVLTHANLLANIRAMGQATAISSTDVFVSWLPLYHDMGLIGAWLGSMFFAAPLVIMSPLAFLARPERWLWAIHRYRGTLSAAPNFAYELCLHKVSDSAIQGLDLGSWRMACNGAEPVSPACMRDFSARFAPCGFHPEAIAPVYGLAESSVGVTFPPPGRGLVVDRIRRDEFISTGRAIPAAGSAGDALEFAASGYPLPGHQIRIVDTMGRELPERCEGRLEFTGPSTTSGYFRNPEATSLLLHGTWLDSGDLAYVAGGDVYITGRCKDIIIKAGRNIYPYELEEAVGGIPDIRTGCVAVFGSSDPLTGTERLIVLAETRAHDPDTRELLRNRITELAMDLLGAPPDDIVLAPPHTVLKTSSGKIRRAASRQLYEENGSLLSPSPVWLQFARLARRSAVSQARSLVAGAARSAYACYVWGLAAVCAPPAWLAACLMPLPDGSWRVSRAAARTFLRLAGIPLHVEGVANLPDKIPHVLVVNHSSYLDGLILVASLPGSYSFVSKRELKNSLFARLYLQKMGAEFVDRFDLLQGVEDAGRMRGTVQNGQSLIIFPEGTFRRTPGLLPFKMGAFLVGARISAPVVPVSLRGTRSILHPDHWFPHRGSVTVTIGAPLRDDGNDWNAAVRIRDAARCEILNHCGEPDLGESG